MIGYGDRVQGFIPINCVQYRFVVSKIITHTCLTRFHSIFLFHSVILADYFEVVGEFGEGRFGQIYKGKSANFRV